MTHNTISPGHIDAKRVYPIYRSTAKVVLLNFLILTIIAWAVHINWVAYAANAHIDGEMKLSIALALLFSAGWAFKILPMLIHINTPAIVLSQEGIAIRNKPLIRWEDMMENIWHAQSYLGFATMGGTLKITGKASKATCEAFTLRISSDEYFRQCERFSSGKP